MIIEFIVPYPDRPARNLVLLSPDFGLNKIYERFIDKPITIGDSKIGTITKILDVSYYRDNEFVRVKANVELLDNFLLNIENNNSKISFESNKETYWKEAGNVLICSCCNNKIKYHLYETYPQYCPYCGRKVNKIEKENLK